MIKSSGFSLFEIAITLAIIGIVTLIALPTYTAHITHEHRIEAEIALEKLAASLEQYNAIHDTYKNATFESLGSSDTIANNTYQLSLTNLTDTEFLLMATPSTEQYNKDSQCGTLTLNNQGEKGITGSNNVTDCW